MILRTHYHDRSKVDLLLISVCPLTANVLEEGRANSLGLLK